MRRTEKTHCGPPRRALLLSFLTVVFIIIVRVWKGSLGPDQRSEMSRKAYKKRKMSPAGVLSG